MALSVPPAAAGCSPPGCGRQLTEMPESETSLTQAPSAIMTEDSAPPQRVIPLTLRSDSPHLCIEDRDVLEEAWCPLFSSFLDPVPAQHWGLCITSSGPCFSLQLFNFVLQGWGHGWMRPQWAEVENCHFFQSFTWCGVWVCLPMGLTTRWVGQGKGRGIPLAQGLFSYPCRGLKPATSQT